VEGVSGMADATPSMHILLTTLRRRRRRTRRKRTRREEGWMKMLWGCGACGMMPRGWYLCFGVIRVLPGEEASVSAGEQYTDVDGRMDADI